MIVRDKVWKQFVERAQADRDGGNSGGLHPTLG